MDTTTTTAPIRATGPIPAEPPDGEPGSALSPAGARDRSIPIRIGDLCRLLLAEPGLTVAEHDGLARLLRLLGSVFHYEYFARLTELKELYAPIDPDSDCVPIAVYSAAHSDGADEAFLGPFEAALVRANYRRLELRRLEAAIAAPSEQGLNYVPDLNLFEHLRVYVRGQGKIPRSARSLRHFFRRKESRHEAYRRMVVVLKFKPGVKLADEDYARSDVLYLRMFRDVPYVEIDMHLPEQGTKVQMRWIDKMQIASPLAIGLPTLAVKFFLLTAISPWIAGTLLIGPISAGVKSFFGFQRTKQRYLHKMIRHLYYLTLANNSSVITRLIDSAEEEDYKEAVLAYFVLWRGRGDDLPWDAARLDAEVEAFVAAKTGLAVDFEIDDALDKLARLGLARRDSDGRLHSTPVDDALRTLDERWDNFFRYSRRRPEADPVSEVSEFV